MRFAATSLLPLLALVAIAGVAACSAPREDEAAARALHAIFDAEWDWEMRQNPTWASSLGDRRWNDRWEDLAPAAFEERREHRLDLQRRLAAIPREALPPADRTHYDVFRSQLDLAIEGDAFDWHLVRTNTYDGVQTAERLVDELRFETVEDYDDWLARLHAFGTWVDQNIALMRRGVERNVLLPKVIMRRIRAQADRLARQTPEESGFARPFRRFPDAMSLQERDRIRRAGHTAVATVVGPAYARLRDFIDGTYLPAAYDRPGIWQTARGAETYAYLARLHTTTALTPDEIHGIGLKEVARIRAAMDGIREEVGFRGSLEGFFDHLRTDPRFFYPTGDALLDGYRALAKRVDPELVKVVRTLPRLPYGVIPVPDAIAPDMTTAYAGYGAADGSRPAYYYVNLYKPETRPKWEMLALTLHEAVPGHCLQGSVAQELEDLPRFRRHAGFTAYVEGWALYAESLGEDMGLYRGDPYAKFGQLTYEMWRAVRLVVDTGIHARQWSREQAIAYFMENAAKTELDVTNEVDRYISWPGQALAYKIGELRIQELRRRAAAALGERFDLRDFNDVVLRTGAVPLDVLERRVDEWIAAQTP